MNTDRKPIFPRTWVVQDRTLVAGCFPADRDPALTEARLQAALDYGLRTFVCLQREDEVSAQGAFPAYCRLLEELGRRHGVQVAFARIAITDNTAPDPATMVFILDVIDASIAAGRPVYVHCWSGHGRTGAVVGCWLVRHGMTGEQALAHVRALRAGDPYLAQQPAPQMPQQMAVVRQWAQLDPRKTAPTPSLQPPEPPEDPKSPGPPAIPLADEEAVIELVAAGADNDHSDIVRQYVQHMGLELAARRSSPHFRFSIGQQCHASGGGLRVIQGYCFAQGQEAMYVVQLSTGVLATKMARKANQEYQPLLPETAQAN